MGRERDRIGGEIFNEVQDITIPARGGRQWPDEIHSDQIEGAERENWPVGSPLCSNSISGALATSPDVSAYII